MMDDAWAEYVGTLNIELTRYFSGLRPRYRTGIVSNSFVGARERELALYGFEELCDTIVYSHEVGVMKPDPAIYLIACRRLDVTPGEVVFLDDVPANVQAAAELGMTAITFLSTDQAIAELQRLLRTTRSLPQR
jgi:putative hydrolase of the HAD superfamily